MASATPPDSETPAAPHPVLRRMSDVTPQPVEWLWPGRIPLGKLTFIDGDPGLGKSLVTVDLAARVTRGKPMPDGAASDLDGPAAVVMLLAEDAAEDTVRPRLDAAGADVKLVYELQGIAAPGKDGIRPVVFDDVRCIREAIDAHGARLVTVDPFPAFVGRRNSHRDEEMRAVLTPLAEIAEQTGAAIVVIRHVRKSGGSAITAGTGSIGITGAARAVLFVGQDPKQENGRVLAVAKLNLGVPGASYSFTIEARDVHMGKQKTDVPVVVWGETSDVTADEMLASAREDSSEKTKVQDAGDWILETLTDEPLMAKTLEKKADRAGHLPKTFQRARSALHKAHKIWRRKGEGMFAEWWWGFGAEPSPEWLKDREDWRGAA